MITHASLFSGIGGPDLAAEWMGWKNIFHCEINGFGKRVLEYYWPQSISYHDITKTDFTIHRSTIDVLSGGFPCQPYSVAGKQKGTDDERHLWPQMLRAIREIAPTYVVAENVGGLVSWSGGLVFEQVCLDLENEGYKIFPCVLPAGGKNAPHGRARIFFIAYSANAGNERMHRGKVNADKHKSTPDTHGIGSDERAAKGNRVEKDETIGTDVLEQTDRSGKEWAAPDTEGERSRELRDQSKEEGTQGSNELSGKQHRLSDGDVADTRSERLKKLNVSKKPKRKRLDSWNNYENATDWKDFPTQSPIYNGDDGLPSRLDGITFPKFRNETIMAGGNAIVPQVIFEIYKVIDNHLKDN